MGTNFIAEGNRLYSNGYYEKALKKYKEAYNNHPELKSIILGNIDKTLRQLRKFKHENNIIKEKGIVRNEKYIVFTMVRDEIDIIYDWICQANELFDEVHIVDHKSTDGTREFLLDLSKKLTKIKLYLNDEDGYFQSKLINDMVRQSKPREKDKLFFLDADEFLPIWDYDELTEEISVLNEPVFSLPWRNLVKLNLDESTEIFNKEMILGPASNTINKVMLQASALEDEECEIDQGAHNLIRKGKLVDAASLYPNLFIIHYPIRSFDQIYNKLLNGTTSYVAMGKMRKKEHGQHWDDLYDQLIEKEQGWNKIIGYAYNYGEKDAKLKMIDKIDMLKNNATIINGQTLFKHQLEKSNTIYNIFIESKNKKIS